MTQGGATVSLRIEDLKDTIQLLDEDEQVTVAGGYNSSNQDNSHNNHLLTTIYFNAISREDIQQRL